MSKGSLLHTLSKNRWIGVILCVLFAILFINILESDWANRVARDNVIVGLLPLLATGSCFLSSLGIALDKNAGKQEQALLTVTPRKLLIMLIFLVLSWVYFEIMRIVGFVTTTVPAFILATYYLGVRNWKLAVIIGLGVTVLVYFVFQVMRVQLPQGLLI